jgi:hypothetical protein
MGMGFISNNPFWEKKKRKRREKTPFIVAPISIPKGSAKKIARTNKREQ